MRIQVCYKLTRREISHLYAFGRDKSPVQIFHASLMAIEKGREAQHSKEAAILQHSDLYPVYQALIPDMVQHTTSQNLRTSEAFPHNDID